MLQTKLVVIAPARWVSLFIVINKLISAANQHSFHQVNCDAYVDDLHAEQNHKDD